MTARLPGLVLVLLACAARAHAATLCVWTNSPHPGAPYNAWTNAAREIQTAVTAAQAGDTVLVTNGLYTSGSYALPTHAVSNRVLITTSIVVRSVNGPAVTVIRGRSAGESGSLLVERPSSARRSRPARCSSASSAATDG